MNLWSKNNLNLPNQLPELSMGKWLSNGWRGAILPVSEVVMLKDPKFQASAVLEFFKIAIEA